MWFKRQSLKDKLHGHKSVRINGIRFVIKKINPLLDFESDRMPALFTDFVSRRKADPNAKPESTVELAKRVLDDLRMILRAGIIDPRIVEKKDATNGDVTVDDLCADMDTAFRLYAEILAHSLNKFRGLRGLFFSAKIKHSLYTAYQRNLAARP